MSEHIESMGDVPFTQVSNKAVRDDDLTAAALAIYTYLRSHHTSKFKLIKKNVEKRFSDLGRVSFNKGWSQLIEKGWIKSERVQDVVGRYTNWKHSVYVDNDQIALDDKTGKALDTRTTDMQDNDFRCTDNRLTESRQTDIHKNTNTNNINIKKIKTKEKASTTPEFSLPDYIEKELWDEYMVERKRLKCSSTPRALKTLLNKLVKIESGCKGAAMIALENANEAGYKSVFAPKSNVTPFNTPHSKAEARSQRNKDVLDQAYRELQEEGLLPSESYTGGVTIDV